MALHWMPFPRPGDTGPSAAIVLGHRWGRPKVGHFIHIGSTVDASGGARRYQVTGQVFFSSADKLVAAFDFKEVLDKVVDLSRAHFWDITAVAALDKVVIKFRREGTEVEVLGLNQASTTIVDRFGVHDKPDAVDQLMGHLWN
jgi:SulP family sulfate permease